jgi:hypothetical protein
MSAKMGCKLTVQYNGQHAPSARRQRFCNRAAAGADLNDCVAGDVSERRNDPLRGLLVHEKVLPELGFQRHLLLRW